MSIPTDRNLRLDDQTDTAASRVWPQFVKPGLKAGAGEEIWLIEVPGTIHLRVLITNRFGQLVEGELSYGPNRQGQQFKLKTVDREENQSRCMNPALDPFLNGMLTRVDADQQDDPSTASADALTTEGILDAFDLPMTQFTANVEKWGEVVMRRMVEIGISMDVGHKKIALLEEALRDRYTVTGGPQTTLGDNKSEQLS
jgi:hypothetical protein